MSILKLEKLVYNTKDLEFIKAMQELTRWSIENVIDIFKAVNISPHLVVPQSNTTTQSNQNREKQNNG